jgi:hypothetical protein
MPAPSQPGTSLLDQIRARIARWLAPEIFALMDPTPASPVVTPLPSPEQDCPPEHWLKMVRERAPQLLQSEQTGGPPYTTPPSLQPQPIVRVAAPARLQPAVSSPPAALRKAPTPVPPSHQPALRRHNSSTPPEQSSAAAAPYSVSVSQSRNDVRAATPPQRPDASRAVSLGPAREPKSSRIEEKIPRPQSNPDLRASLTAEQQAPPILMWIEEMPLSEPKSETTQSSTVKESWNTATNGTVEVAHPTASDQPRVVPTAFENLRDVSVVAPQFDPVSAVSIFSHRWPRLNPQLGTRPPRNAPPQLTSDTAPKARWPRLLELTHQEEDWHTRHDRETRDLLLRREQNGGD